MVSPKSGCRVEKQLLLYRELKQMDQNHGLHGINEMNEKIIEYIK